MVNFIILIFVFLIGFFGHLIMMKINFKQRTIDDKIKVYDLIIASWAKMRNHIFSNDLNNLDKKWSQQKMFELDKIYGESQTHIAKIFLISENIELAKDIDSFNENFYRSNWSLLDLSATNQKLDQLKRDVLPLLEKMRSDVKESTIFHLTDIIHMFSGLNKTKKSV